MRRLFGYLALCVFAWPLAAETSFRAAAAIRIDPSVQYQRILGWEIPVLVTVQDYIPVLPAFESIFEQAATDLGLTRLTFDVFSGFEQPPGYQEQYLNGTLTEPLFFRSFGRNVKNDNSNPNVANLKGFDFAIIDWRMEHFVLPYRRHLEATGQKLYTYLTFVDSGPSSALHRDSSDEYAELMLVVFDHLKTKYGFVPDGINVMNEPDLRGWKGAMVGRALVRTATRLAAAGYRPDFIVPSTTDSANAPRFFDEIVGVSGARAYVTSLTYHCYRDIVTKTLPAVARRAALAKVDVSMNECWGNGSDAWDLHNGLKFANSSTWQQGTLNGRFSGYYAVDPVTLKVSLSEKTKLTRQYYKYVRPGARRIEAETDDANMDPVAFINTDGKHVVVIRAERGGTFSIGGLAPGSYGISHAVRRQDIVALPDVMVTEGGILAGQIPGPGIATVFGK
jgi:hypothetical protein